MTIKVSHLNILAILLLSIIFFLGNIIFIFPKFEGYIYYALFAILVLIFNSNLKIKKEFNKKYKRILLLFFLISILSIIYNSDSFIQLKSNTLIFAIALLAHIVILTNNQTNDKVWLKLFIALTIFHSLIGLLQLVNFSAFKTNFNNLLISEYENAYYFKQGRITALWLSAPRFGTILCALLPYILYAISNKKEYFTAIFALILSLIMILLGITRIVVLVSLANLVLFYIQKKRKKIVLIGLVVFLLIRSLLNIFDSQNIFERLDPQSEMISKSIGKMSTYNRYAIFETMKSKIFESPILGMGIRYREYLQTGFTSVHNVLLHFLLYYGFPSTILFILLFLYAGRISIKNISQVFSNFSSVGFISALNIVVIGMFHTTLFDRQIFFLFWISLAFALRYKQDLIRRFPNK